MGKLFSILTSFRFHRGISLLYHGLSWTFCHLIYRREPVTGVQCECQLVFSYHINSIGNVIFSFSYDWCFKANVYRLQNIYNKVVNIFLKAFSLGMN